MTASSSVNQPKGIVMKQEQCVFTELYMESKCSKNLPGRRNFSASDPPLHAVLSFTGYSMSLPGNHCATFNYDDHYLFSSEKWSGQNLTSLTACYGLALAEKFKFKVPSLTELAN